jgi:hypothetical protein
MRRPLSINFFQITFFVVFSLICLKSNSQIIQVEVLGGAVVTQGSTVTINAGSSLDFRITNVETANCAKLDIKGVDIANTTDFDISPNNPKDKIKPQSCKGDHNLDFQIENISGSCSTASTLVTIEIKNQLDFTFTLEVNSSPEIFVLGGSPYADIYHGDITTSPVNGTYFGVVEENASVTRTYAISNIGSCNLDISSLSSTNSDFVTSSPFPIPWNNIVPFGAIIFNVTFTGPVAGAGTQTSVISIGNTDNTTFTFTVTAEMFDFNIPGPGGITADFRLWLKTTRGITTTASKVSTWADVGTNGKDATQVVSAKQPTYIDSAADNINFNPVIKFENDGATVEQYLENTSNGFYSQDIFIVMVPDATMTSASARSTIFSGTSSGLAGDITGLGFGDYTSRFTNEVLSYNQDVPSPSGLFNGVADDVTISYDKAGIINVRNNVTATAQDLLYNSDLVSASTINDIPYLNVGYTDVVTPFTVYGTEYWIGRNFDVQGSLNGRIAEIFTFAERLTDADRQKVESYLGIKYGITLGALTVAEKDYINSFNTSVWDITANAGYNYDVAGIGRDSISDLNQKQSKTLNLANDVSISLGNIFTTNSSNTNEFKKDGDFLVWGNNNSTYTGTSTNIVTVATGITTSLTRIDRKWKIVESNEDVNGDVGTVYVSIPSAAFSGFTKTATEEYALIVADNANFADADIIDVIPLRTDGGSNLQTWYDFDGAKFFTFGKVSKLSENHSINIAAGDYLVGESALNLSVDNFTISAWVKCAANASNRTVMAKGEKLQIRLNITGNIEVFIEDEVTPKYTSNMDVDDGKWHHTTFVYDSGTIKMYIDGVLDNSVQGIVHPSPNFNNYCIGALYIDKDNVINPLLGEIDEVSVWDLELSEAQIRYLMNQEIERFDIAGTDYVNGKIIPQASASNETAAIPWSSLRVYYDFNSFYGSTIEGLTDGRYFLRLKYLDKDKSLIEAQTAPFPYISLANGAWDTPATWSNNIDQMIPNSLSLDGVTTIDWNIVEISHDITSGDRDISLLGLIQTAGTLTIADPVDSQDETNSGQGLTISNYLELDGVIDLIGESQLVQKEGSIIDADSGGYIEKDQQGTANGFNYNYWSSSVGPSVGDTATRGTGISSTNLNHTLMGVLNDGTISGLYQSLFYDASPDASGVVTPPGLAKTLSTAWLYKFYGADNDYYAWGKIDETTSLLAGEGFTMKGTSGAVPISTQQNYVFVGLPNNGDITLELDKTSGEVARLIGNPYPSAIDVEEFILDNMSIADGGNNATGTIFNGALYFWDHFGETNSHDLKGYVGGYATRNLTGGAPAISNDIRINNNLVSGTKVPGPYIPVNQGFFVSTVLEGFNNDNGTPILTVNGGDIIFKNSQRVFVTELEESSPGVSVSVFMKNSKGKTANKIANVKPKNNTPTIRLSYDSPIGYHRQLVIGANNKASNGFDLGYDAFMVDVNEEDMYWNVNNNKFVIQGVDKFDETQEFLLGLIVKNSGTAKIKLEAIENFESNLSILIKDELTGETKNINTETFEVNLEPGLYNDRFKLVFRQLEESSIVIESAEEVSSIAISYNSKFSELNLTNTGNIIIKDIVLYDILGNEIKSIRLNTNSDVKLSVSAITGLYIVKINTENGVETKKIIIE